MIYGMCKFYYLSVSCSLYEGYINAFADPTLVSGPMFQGLGILAGNSPGYYVS